MKRSFIYRDRNIITSKIKEAFFSVFPIALVILVLSVTVVPIESGILLSFLVGAFLTVVGMGLFALGADIAMTPIGNYVGKEVVKTKKLWIILPVYFVVGILITIAEPDLQVLASELEGSINKWVLIVSVGVGVGLFLVIAFLRMVLKIKLKYLLLVFYVIVFALAVVLKINGLESFIPLSFDSGGVTTGPMSVPFIIAIGTGVASLRMDKGAENDGFGLTALCSIGPILSVMILGLIFRPEITSKQEEVQLIYNSKELLHSYSKTFLEALIEVAIALLPIVIVFFITHFIGSKIGKSAIIKICIGIFYTYLGLVLFLVGVKNGFLPMGKTLGEGLGSLSYNFIAIPIGMVLGFFVVSAEPAVHVLTEQVYEITKGGIPKKALSVSLMIGVAFSVGLSMLRILLDINLLWIIVPGYVISIILMFFVPDIFIAVAFDSGGVASGAMTSSFLLPLALGICEAVGGNVALNGFGVIATVAITPLIAIQILGLIYKIKTSKKFGVLKKKRKKEEIIE